MTVGDLCTRNLLQAATDIERTGGMITRTNVDVPKTLRSAVTIIGLLKAELAKAVMGQYGDGAAQVQAGHAACDEGGREQEW